MPPGAPAKASTRRGDFDDIPGRVSGTDPAVIVTLVISVAGVIFASITAPLILARRTERVHRADQLTEYQRQDQVAKLAAETSAALLAQQRDMAEAAAERAAGTDQRLDVIHGLVNSSLSAAFESALDALVTSLAMMHEVIDLKREAGHEPAPEAVIALRDTEARIAELRITLADREQQAQAIASRGDASP